MVDQLVPGLPLPRSKVHANEKEGHICLTWRGELRVTLMTPYLSCSAKISGYDTCSTNTLLDTQSMSARVTEDNVLRVLGDPCCPVNVITILRMKIKYSTCPACPHNP